MSAKKSVRLAVIATLCLSGISSFAQIEFTETFTSNVANWRANSGGSNMTWVASGGPGGTNDAYASNPHISFAGNTDGQYPVIVRGHVGYGSSGGVFAGNWLTSGVYALTVDLRHNLGVPATVVIRTAGNPGLGTAIFPDTQLASDTWGRYVLPISADIAGYAVRSYEAGSFSANFAFVDKLQFGLVVPPGFGGSTNLYTLDVDNVGIRLSGTNGWGGETFSAASPTYDRWMYQFNMSSPAGNRPDAGTFMTDDNRFDYRDAQAYFAFSLTNDIPTGLGAENYEVLSCRVNITMGAGEAVYDDTQDGWETYLYPTNFVDSDAGRPMELFGAGWRTNYTPWTFGEDGPYSTPPVFDFGNTNAYVWKNIRNVYALGFKDGQPVDVSNSIDPDNTGTNGYDPVVFAIGKTDLMPGDSVPLGTTFAFDIDTANTNIQAYLANSLNDGIVSFVLASLQFSTQTNRTGYPSWDQKESVVGTPASLELTYRMAGLGPQLDIEQSGDVHVVRWPLSGARGLLEATKNLDPAATNGVWQPVFVQVATNETHIEAVLPKHTGTNEIGNTWFLRLRQP